METSSEELVARAIAPVKKEFLRPPPESRNTTTAATDEPKPASAAPIIKEKKSKRQLKRERQVERNSPLHLCPQVAKTGIPSACRYADKCRYSHDVEAFKSHKPEDLPGDCPFLHTQAPCPYGLTCRFEGTHNLDAHANANAPPSFVSEVNALSKDVQRLLWKNQMNFSKADATLKALGLVGKKKIEQKGEDHLTNGSSHLPGKPVISAEGETEEVKLVHMTLNDDDDKNRPLKKVKTDDDDDATVGEPVMTAEGETEEVKLADTTVNDDDDDDATVGEPVIITEGETEEVKLVHTAVNDDDKKETADDVTVASNVQLPLETDASLNIHPRERKIIDFREKLYLAPLTTVGNLPFRRLCKKLGVDVTCGEMAMCTNLLQGQASEWALLRRHSSEDLFGVQICGAHPDTVARAVELIDRECSVDFIDVNMGCPIDIVVNKGAGSALLTKPMRMKGVVQAASGTVNTPITIKVRTGYFEGKNRIDSLIADIGDWGATAVTIHGRSRQQRYSKLADWEYINRCARLSSDSLQVIGNGDVFSYLDWNNHKSDSPELSTCMIARGALIKPWIFTEIKEQRHWDISSAERLNILKDYVHFGLDHWGSDSKGVETTRYFLLEWLSYACRYIPVGLLDVVPQKINWRQPSYYGRDELETLMGSDSAADWIRISEMLLGKVPPDFTFAPKHKSNAYDRAENG